MQACAIGERARVCPLTHREQSRLGGMNWTGSKRPTMPTATAPGSRGLCWRDRPRVPRIDLPDPADARLPSIYEALSRCLRHRAPLFACVQTSNTPRRWHTS